MKKALLILVIWIVACAIGAAGSIAPDVFADPINHVSSGTLNTYLDTFVLAVSGCLVIGSVLGALLGTVRIIVD